MHVWQIVQIVEKVGDVSSDSTNNQEPSRANILIVDDTLANLRVLSKVLSSQGYKARGVPSGQMALTAARSAPPDLILLDISMPEMDGYETCLAMKEDSRTRDIPIIFISALDEALDKVKAFDVGGVDYITKPFQVEEVLIRIAHQLQLCQLQQQLQQQNQLLEREVEQRIRAEGDVRRLNEELASLVKLRTQQLAQAEAELNVARQLQKILLPSDEELQRIHSLDIAGFMEPADTVGGDYYDVLQDAQRVHIAIGDVTGHGIESGVMMLIVQSAVRTLLSSQEPDVQAMLTILNRIVYGNLQRLKADKSMTLALLSYQPLPDNHGQLELSGQHEEVLVIRCDGSLERVDTIDLGFPLGLQEDISDFVAQTSIHLAPGDGVVLYTDGITEAESSHGKHYSLERLCQCISANWQQSAEGIREAIIREVHQHCAGQVLYDDITLLVLKQRAH